MTVRRAGAPIQLSISGEVEHPHDLGLDAIHQLSSVRTGHELAPAGRVVPVGALLELAGPAAGAGYATFESGDGHYRASVPLADASGKGWLLIGPDAGGLDRSAGGPMRLIVQDGDTLCWNVKNVVAMRITNEKEPDSVPEDPPH